MALTNNRILHLMEILLPATLILSVLGIPLAMGYLEDRPPVYLEAKVGSYVILNCPVDFPKNDPIPYVLHWNKDVSSEHFSHDRSPHKVLSCCCCMTLALTLCTACGVSIVVNINISDGVNWWIGRGLRRQRTDSGIHSCSANAVSASDRVA